MSVARQLFSRIAPQVGRRSLMVSSVKQDPANAKEDKVTHTGQQFSEADPRNVRFAVTGLEKQVNDKWAIDLIAQVPPIVSSKRVVSCDGGGGALGHPKVYINLDGGEPVACIYCGLRYVFDPKKKDEDHH